MCDRHVAHLIAEYEAARLEGATPDENGEQDADSSEQASSSTTPNGLLRAVAGRLSR